jgi:hypothetical protein
MTAALEKAVGAIAALPADRQEAIAALIFEEIESERRWDEQFAGSQDQLGQMAREALAELQRGETRPLEKDSDLADH